MNQKLNWTRRGRANAAGVSIPVRFDIAGTAFHIKIKYSSRNGLLILDPPLIPGVFDSRPCADGVDTLSQVLFRRGPAVASMTLHETMLDERRLEAVLKAAGKKRC